MMNERMTELYAKACLDARDKHFEDKDVPAFIACMAEKFAELLVEEMYDFIMEEVGNDNGIPDLGKIKQHFGVES